MKVNQIATILNSVYGEVLGTENMVQDDLSNIVSAGQFITEGGGFGDNFDNYVGKIIDKVGRTIFWDRVYTADDLGIWRHAFEYGSVLEKIEPSAFKDCTKLSYIAIPEGVTAISKYAFRGCSSLAEIALPESLKSIGEGAFLGCEALKTVNVPKADYLSGIVLNGTYADPTVYGATVIAK